jgi:uncharacterized iron-regulated membrane protein
MKFGLSPGFVKSALSSHTWIGLLVGIPMYLVCLSGTLAVFYQELERWEQPQVAEDTAYEPAAIQRAYDAAVGRITQKTEHMFVQLPTADMPRAAVSSAHEGWFINRDGTLGKAVAHEWTHLLINLHLYLHLPANVGLLIVSTLGAMLCGLIVSGFLAHPRLFRDAFHLRLEGSRQLEQADIHNRLSVWGAPFHLMIGVTGAYFGLAAIMVGIFASVYFGGDRKAAMTAVFGPEPTLSQAVETAAVGNALDTLHTVAPHDQTPFFITVDGVGTPGQFIMIGTSVPHRLTFAEQYRFDAAGNYLDKAGTSDGEAGRQIAASVYRIHFGAFGGLPVKVLYFVFGLALTVVSVTGINIWLARRKMRNALNNVWTGIVWGTPMALALSATTQIVFHIPSTGVFWGMVVLTAAGAQAVNDDGRVRALYQISTAVLLAVFLAAYTAKFKAAAFAPVMLSVNSAIAAAGLIFAFMAWRHFKKAAQALQGPSP